MASSIDSYYKYTPHQRLHQMRTTAGLRYQLEPYKLVMNAALALFVLGLISFASCWRTFAFVGLPHLLAAVYPYCGQVLHPTFYFCYTCCAGGLILINFFGGLSSGCVAIPMLIELPELVLSYYVLHMLSKVEPGRLPVLPWPGAATTATTTQPVMRSHEMQASAIVTGVPVQEGVEPAPVVEGSRV